MRPGRTAARSLRRVGALVAFALSAASLLAALEGYYRISDIGSSADAPLANWQPMTAPWANFERPLNATKLRASELAFAKLLNKHSPPLMLRAFTGQLLSSVVVNLRNAGEPFPVYVFNLKNCAVLNYSLSSESAASGRVTENIALSFTSLEASVTRSDSDQSLSSTSTTWNFSTGALVTNAAPTLSLAATTLTTNEDTPATMGYTHSDDYSDLENLTRTATSSDPALVAPNGLAFSGTGSGRLLTVTPVANASGTATITVTLRDTAGQTKSSSFALTVNPVNDAPGIAAVATQSVNVGTTRDVAVSLSDVDTALSSVTLSATSDNSSVLPASGIALSGTGASRTLSLTPAAAGSAIVTLIANDGSANSAPVTFTIIANPVGTGIPTEITLNTSTVAENATTGTVIGTLGVVDADNNSGHTYALADDAGGRFALHGAQLVVATGAALDYESAPTHAVTVRVTDPDNHTFSQQLTLTVTNVNEAPAVTLGLLGSAAPGRTLALAAISFADPDAGNADVRAEFSVLHGSLTCASSGALAGKVTGHGTATLTITAPLADLNAALAAGALAYAPDAAFIGDDILQVVCSDLGHSGSGGALTDTRLAAIPVALDSFAAWQARHFSPDELADPAVSGPQSSLLGDGFSNLLRYALGLGPREPAAAHPQFAPSVSEWIFTYQRPAMRPDLVYAVEVSGDLLQWSTDGVTHAVASRDARTDTETWRATYPRNSTTPVFVRLRVTLTSR